MIVDGDVHVLPTGAGRLTPAAAIGTHAHRAKAAQLLDVEVEQIAGMRMFVAQHGRGGLKIAHAVEVQTEENAGTVARLRPVRCAMRIPVRRWRRSCSTCWTNSGEVGRRRYKRLLPLVDLTVSDVEDMNRLRSQMRSVEPSIIDSKRAIQQMLDLEALSNESPLLFLGYFAFLESQLTHHPKPTDTIDSITRLIIEKVALLENRWQPKVDYSHFQGAKRDTVWSAMYRYRSVLAHGVRA